MHTRILLIFLVVVACIVACGNKKHTGTGDSTGGRAPGAAFPGSASGGSGSGGGGSGSGDNRICGVTIDQGTRIGEIDKLDEVITALGKLPVTRPAVRVVFDEGVAASEYLDAVKQLSKVADVMGELVDSWYVSGYSESEYSDRATEYLQALGDYVAIWEIGNEINGEWLGDQVIDKVQAAYNVFKGAGKKVAVNFYYNEGCGALSEYEMFNWIDANIPTTSALRNGLDWVLFSYYEDDCGGVVYDAAHWEDVFNQLGKIFPVAKLGFGEVGTLIQQNKQSMVESYYGMKLSHPRFIGGFFWWYFWQDRASVPAWITAVW
jgi:hypothetical protein